VTTSSRIAVTIGLVVLVWLALELLLLLFAGCLLAVFLRTLASWVAAFTPLSVRLALAAVLITLLSAAGVTGWLYAPSLAEQSDQLATAVPEAFRDLTSWLDQYAWGRWLLDQAPDGSPKGMDVVQPARQAAGTLFRLGVMVAVVLFTGLYLAAEPETYTRGVLRLVPLAHRRRAAETLYAAVHVLRWWLLGQAFAMLFVGLTMGIGLAVIGVPLALILGVLAGLFEFIPLVGPLLGLGPALLLAFADSMETAGYVLILYAFVQTLEANVLTPLIQRRAVRLPPVVTIAAQVGLSWAAGPVGLLVAVPLVAVVMVTVQILYVKDALADSLKPEFENAARKEVREDEQAPNGTLRGLFND
jgi:predicted PurR-regulated permease PerM